MKPQAKTERRHLNQKQRHEASRKRIEQLKNQPVWRVGASSGPPKLDKPSKKIPKKPAKTVERVLVRGPGSSLSSQPRHPFTAEGGIVLEVADSSRGSWAGRLDALSSDHVGHEEALLREMDLYELGRSTVRRGVRLTAADYAIVRGEAHGRR
jgi:hypothetical protein